MTDQPAEEWAIVAGVLGGARYARVTKIVGETPAMVYRQDMDHMGRLLVKRRHAKTDILRRGIPSMRQAQDILDQARRTHDSFKDEIEAAEAVLSRHKTARNEAVAAIWVGNV